MWLFDDPLSWRSGFREGVNRAFRLLGERADERAMALNQQAEAEMKDAIVELECRRRQSLANEELRRERLKNIFTEANLGVADSAGALAQVEQSEIQEDR